MALAASEHKVDAFEMQMAPEAIDPMPTPQCTSSHDAEGETLRSDSIISIINGPLLVLGHEPDEPQGWTAVQREPCPCLALLCRCFLRCLCCAGPRNHQERIE